MVPFVVASHGTLCGRRTGSVDSLSRRVAKCRATVDRDAKTVSRRSVDGQSTAEHEAAGPAVRAPATSRPGERVPHRQYPSDSRATAAPVRRTLLGTLCWARGAEITYGLVDLLTKLVHRIIARAGRRVEGGMIADLRRVAGKEALLFRLAEAALGHPDEMGREALHPMVGEATLRDLASEERTDRAAFKRRVRAVLRSSYSGYYQRMLPKLLSALSFRCRNTAYRQVMDALELLGRYAEASWAGAPRDGGASATA